MKEIKSKRIYMRATSDLIKRLADQAKRAGLSKSEYIRKLIEKDAKVQPGELSK